MGAGLLYSRPFEYPQFEDGKEQADEAKKELPKVANTPKYAVKVLSENIGRHPVDAEDTTWSQQGSQPAFVVTRGTRFVKKWVVQNVGTEDWPGDGRLQVRCMLGDASPFKGFIKKIHKKVRSLQRCTITLVLDAPDKAGTYFKNLCMLRLVIVPPGDADRPAVDPARLVFQSFEENSLFMTIRVT